MSTEPYAEVIYGWDLSALAQNNSITDEIWEILDNIDHVYDYYSGKFLIIGTSLGRASGIKVTSINKITKENEYKAYQALEQITSFFKTKEPPQLFLTSCYR